MNRKRVGPPLFVDKYDEPPTCRPGFRTSRVFTHFLKRGVIDDAASKSFVGLETSDASAISMLQTGLELQAGVPKLLLA
jgi:hypothetical protein